MLHQSLGKLQHGERTTTRILAYNPQKKFQFMFPGLGLREYPSSVTIDYLITGENFPVKKFTVVYKEKRAVIKELRASAF